MHTQELWKYTGIEITESDLTEEKLFPCTDSAVVKG